MSLHYDLIYSPCANIALYVQSAVKITVLWHVMLCSLVSRFP
jgi:hypothetical protein